MVETCMFYGLDILYNFSTYTRVRLFFKREAALSVFECILRKTVLVQHEFCFRWIFSLVEYRPFENYLYETWSSKSFLLFIIQYFVHVLYHQLYLMLRLGRILHRSFRVSAYCFTCVQLRMLCTLID